jgi:hypothetical protein
MEEDANETAARDIVPGSVSAPERRPVRAETRATLVDAIARGRRWLDEIVTGTVTSVEQIAARENCSIRQVNMTISLAFLAPELVKAAVKDPGDLRGQTRDGARNGFGEPRDRKPKSAQSRPSAASRDRTRVFEPRKRPQNAGYSSETGKRRFVSECVVVDAAPIEPVSKAKFPC